MIQHSALGRAGHGTIVLISALDVVEIRLLLGIVGCAELVCTLKHQVLQIVGKTGSLGRVVARTRTYGDVRLYARLLLIYRQINLKSVGQGVDACLHRVALNGLVVVG